LLLTCLVLDLAGIASGLSQRALLLRIAGGEQLAPGEAQANDVRHAGIGKLQVAAFILTAVCWLIWQARAYGNLRLVGTAKSRFTQGWSIGYWFVPFINLVRPYQIIADLWTRSESQNTERATVPSAPSAVSLWWGGYLVTAFVGRLVLSMSQDSTTIESLRTVTDLGMAQDALGVLSALLAIRVVASIDRFQQHFVPA
jgi:hypothetical protein